jgi:hypothetical protein
MKVLLRIEVLLLLALLSCISPARAATLDSIHQVKTGTGQTYIIVYSPDATTAQIDIYFRVGSVFEPDSIHGVTLAITRIFDQQFRQMISTRPASRIVYQSMVDPEQTRFHIECPSGDIGLVCSWANQVIMHPKFDATTLAAVQTDLVAEIESNRSNPNSRDDSALLSHLWSADYHKLTLYQDEAGIVKLTPAALKKFHNHYFLPLNNYITITGATDVIETCQMMEKVFVDFVTKEFNPEYIVNVLDFKPVVNYTQLIASNTRSHPVATISYQAPGARQDRRSAYCAYILAELINDPDGRIQKNYRQAGMNNLRAAYTCNNYSGVFKISVECDSGKYMSMYSVLSRLMDEVNQKGYFKDGELEVAGRNIGIRLKEYKDNAITDYLHQSMRFRFSGDEYFFTSMPDSLRSIRPSQMESYIVRYFRNVCGVKLLYTPTGTIQPTDIDEKYYELDSRIGDVIWHYRDNQTRLETDSDRTKLQLLIQWLKINPDMQIQVNGIADAHEHSKVYDDTIMHFINTDSTFHKAMPDKIKKRALPTESMRAMRIMKQIYESGITFDRITGTSMVFHSATSEQAAKNRRCTITLEKQKPKLSLYEYHFGNKR